MRVSPLIPLIKTSATPKELKTKVKGTGALVLIYVLLYVYWTVHLHNKSSLLSLSL